MVYDEGTIKKQHHTIHSHRETEVTTACRTRHGIMTQCGTYSNIERETVDLHQ